MSGITFEDGTTLDQLIKAFCTETCGECGKYGLNFTEKPCIDDAIV